jgi:lipopolysaccharide biosynthesis glycosyltransferase
MRKAILWVTDERGLKLAEHSVAAALLTQSVSPCLIFCVGFEPPANTNLNLAAKRLGRAVEYRPLRKREVTEKLHRGKGAHKHVSSAAMLKMDALWSLNGEFDRALYVDNDVLLMKDFGLGAVEFDGFAIAAVYDLGKVGELGDDAGFHSRCEESGLSPHYFNAGVLAIDLDALSERHVEAYQSGLVDHFSRCGYNPTCSCNDQCVWNMTFAGAWKRLPLSHNFQACAMFNKGWREAKARHYVGPAKFVPLRKWRNDRRDIALIREAQILLGLSPIGKAGLGITRRLNALRHVAARRKADRAVARVEEMQNAPI